MWVAFNIPNRGTGWMSVVAKDRNGEPSALTGDGEMSVRFRREEDALSIFPANQVVHTPGGDYHYRVFVKRKKFASMMATLVDLISYDNFKDTIPITDVGMLDAAHAIWADAASLQEQPPYSNGVDWNTFVERLDD